MKNILFILAFLIVPFTMNAQNNDEPKNEVIKPAIKKEVVLKKVEPISINPKVQNKTLNFSKSQELISVKAYMRSLNMKRKETLMS